MLKRLKEFLTPFASTLSSEEILPGVVKPSWALAGMVAAHVLKNADKVTGDNLVLTKAERTQVLYEKNRSARYADDKMVISANVYFMDVASSSYKNVELIRTCSVSLNGKPYPFDEAEQKLIVEVMKKAAELKNEARRNKEMAALQQEACDHIEKLFGAREDDPSKSARTEGVIGASIRTTSETGDGSGADRENSLGTPSEREGDETLSTLC